MEPRDFGRTGGRGSPGREPRGSPGRVPRGSPGRGPRGSHDSREPWGISGPGQRGHGGGTLDICQRLGPGISHPNGQRLGVDNRDTCLYYVAACLYTRLNVHVLVLSPICFVCVVVVNPSRFWTAHQSRWLIRGPSVVDPRTFSFVLHSILAFAVIENVIFRIRSGKGWITCGHVLEPPPSAFRSST